MPNGQLTVEPTQRFQARQAGIAAAQTAVDRIFGLISENIDRLRSQKELSDAERRKLELFIGKQKFIQEQNKDLIRLRGEEERRGIRLRGEFQLAGFRQRGIARQAAAPLTTFNRFLASDFFKNFPKDQFTKQPVNPETKKPFTIEEMQDIFFSDIVVPNLQAISSRQLTPPPGFESIVSNLERQLGEIAQTRVGKGEIFKGVSLQQINEAFKGATGRAPFEITAPRAVPKLTGLAAGIAETPFGQAVLPGVKQNLITQIVRQQFGKAPVPGRRGRAMELFRRKTSATRQILKKLEIPELQEIQRGEVPLEEFTR